MNSKHYAAIGLTLLCAASPAFADLTISNKPTQNVTCTGGVCMATAKKAVLNISDLTTMLATEDVTIASGSLAHDIEIDAALGWASSSRLTLDAYRTIEFSQPVSVRGSGAVTIKTNDGGTGGDFRFLKTGHIKFWDPLASTLSINGNNYILVASINQLKKVVGHEGRYVALAQSLNLSKHIYFKAPVASLDGTFDGLGNVISNLTINDSTANDNVALFGLLGGSSGHEVLRDIGLKAVNIHGNGGCVAPLLAGTLDGTIANSYATGQVSVVSDGQFEAGGLVCINASGSITNSYASVSISVTGTPGGGELGGLAAENDGFCEIKPCIGVISSSYSTGTVTGIDGTKAGGLVGANKGGIILDSYSTSTVSAGNNSFVGGLVGSNENLPSEMAFPVVKDVYSTGAVSGGSGATIGGLIGQDIGDPGIMDAYWDLDTSGVSDPSRGAGNVENDSGIVGLTDIQLKSGLPAGFVSKVWTQRAKINSGYPYLIDNAPQ